MTRRRIIVAIVAVLMGLLLADEDALEDWRDAGLKTASGSATVP